MQPSESTQNLIANLIALSQQEFEALDQNEKAMYYNALAYFDFQECDENLSHFTKKIFPILEPGKTYSHNYHIDLIGEYLTAVYQGQIRHLAINIQPRAMKSLKVSVAFPCWVWTKEPRKRFICSSYSGDLSTNLNLKRRRIIKSKWFQTGWNHVFQLVDDQDRKTEFENNHRGVMVATSTGATIGGKGGDIILVDDPQNPAKANSHAERIEANEHFKYLATTRLDSAKTGAVVLIMQRLHEEDATALALDMGYEPLIIPTIAPEQKTYVFPITKKEIKREAGDLLWPERFPIEELDRYKKALGSFGFASQYQQTPVPIGGAILKSDWFNYYTDFPSDIRPRWFWDTAVKKDQENDYTVGGCFHVEGDKVFILDWFRSKVEFPELVRTVKNCHAKHRGIITVEDKSSGQQLIQVLEKETELPVKRYKPEGDKVHRAHLASPVLEAGAVFLPDGAEWVHDFLRELELFPRAVHDDQVDVFTMAIISLMLTDTAGSWSRIGKKEKLETRRSLQKPSERMRKKAKQMAPRW